MAQCSPFSSLSEVVLAMWQGRSHPCNKNSFLLPANPRLLGFTNYSNIFSLYNCIILFWSQHLIWLDVKELCPCRASIIKNINIYLTTNKHALTSYHTYKDILFPLGYWSNPNCHHSVASVILKLLSNSTHTKKTCKMGRVIVPHPHRIYFCISLLCKIKKTEIWKLN